MHHKYILNYINRPTSVPFELSDKIFLKNNRNFLVPVRLNIFPIFSIRNGISLVGKI